MLKNYLTTAIRNLIKHKSYSAISIFGLSVGIAFCILILALVQHEWSFDNFHENGDRIYRLLYKDARMEKFSSLNHPDIAAALKQEIPGIIRATEVVRSKAWVKYQGHNFEEEFIEVQPDFLQMFSYPLIVGDSESALDNPDAVLISEELAQKYFNISDTGYDRIIGKALQLRNEHDFVITGVFRDVPLNSSL